MRAVPLSTDLQQDHQGRWSTHAELLHRLPFKLGHVPFTCKMIPTQIIWLHLLHIKLLIHYKTVTIFRIMLLLKNKEWNTSEATPTSAADHLHARSHAGVGVQNLYGIEYCIRNVDPLQYK
ncbi:hypothetical protein ACJX0J_039165, partial [Zea mays]